MLYRKSLPGVVFLLLFMISCSNSDFSEKNSLILFDLKELREVTALKLSDLGAEEIEYIPLETCEQSVISRISKIIVSSDFFLVVYSTDIYMFRHDGSFVRMLGAQGRGPGEFNVVHDIDINPADENIYIVDGWQQKFFVFSVDGDLIRTFKSPVSAALNFRFTGDGILSYNQNHMGVIENSFILFDTTGLVIRNFPNKYPWKRTVPNVAYQAENIFYKYNRQLFKKEIYCDTIFLYNNQAFEPHAVIDIGSLRLTPEARTEETGLFILHNFLVPMNLFEFGDYIFYEFINPRIDESKKMAFIASKNDHFRAVIDSEQGLINDLDGGPDISPRGVWDDNTLFTWVEAMDFKEWVKSEAFSHSQNRFPLKKAELEKLANSLKETDNPVLVLVRFEN